ncbi:alpha/beta hydrolase [Catenulispora pinisilvae]|uniref:alpha/beta hydrolase n=1 Tax=Catenulispora pinisilvae TaxID=2705253 RepID=UPI001890C43C|nr:alpha/beta hydrolase-fold protein [Catenulispora pinisilvae]
MDVSLLGGWLPWTLRVATVALVVVAIGRRRLRDRGFLLKRLPIVLGVSVLFGVLCAVLVRTALGVSDPLPFGLWFWLAVFALAIGLAVACWRGSRWWQRTAAPVAMLLAVLTAGDALDISLRYYPTLADMYGELTDQALPQQVSLAQLGTIHGNTKTGRIVEVQVPDTASGFQHRSEYVYLPPAWFRSTHRPKLPVVEMIGGEYAVPDNWIRSGNAIKTADAYAAAHHGFAPVLVFVDATGGFKVDTECVDGPAGQAMDHLVKDIPPYVEKTFGTATIPGKWAVAGWSMGGTCAITLALTHPAVFGHFLDISGDLGPNKGDKNSTIATLYGGNAAEFAADDPMTILGKRKKWPKGFSGMFAVGNQESAQPKHAQQLSGALKKDHIPNQIWTGDGKHSWVFAQAAFAQELPWLAKAVQVPGAK